tara:strand:+ start:318 stop:926 length:609 start_codon:yes stop_codon:yes gene_type:complete
MAIVGKILGKMSIKPLMEIDDGADADGFFAMQHDVKVTLTSDITINFHTYDKWYYAPNVIVLKSEDQELIGASDDLTDLVGASGDQTNGPNEAAGSTVEYTDGSTIDCSTAIVRFIYIKNTGYTDINNTPTDNSVYVTFDDNDSTDHNTQDAIEIAAGEAWMGRFNEVNPDQIHIRAGGYLGTTADEDTVRCTVLAKIATQS